MIHVIANIEVKPDRVDDYLEVILGVVPEVLAEDGCLDYGPAQDVETEIDAQMPVRPNVVTMVERWRDLDALQSHLSAPHMIEYRNKVEDMVENVTLQILRPV